MKAPLSPPKPPRRGFPRSSPPRFGRSLLTSVLLHGTVLCGAILLTPGVRRVAGAAWKETSVVFAEPSAAPQNMAAVEEPREEVTAEEPPEPELVEVPLEPDVSELLKDEPELDAVSDAERIWADVALGRLARAASPPVDPGAGLPPTDEPVDQAEVAPPAAPLATGPVLVAAPVPDYPLIARRLKLEGSVLLRFHISARGRLLRCDVVESSGYERLDEAALEAVQGWAFLPATSSGVPIEGSLLHRVTFGLDS